MVKKGNNKRLIFGIIIFLSVASMFFYMFSPDGFKFLTVSFDDGLSGDIEEISQLEIQNCFSVDSCKQVLIDEGIPENFLEETNSIIKCNGKCFLVKNEN